MVAHRPDWVLSRQRVWGVPIVAFYCASCGGLLLEERVVEHVAGIFRAGRGIEEWYLRPRGRARAAGHALRLAAAAASSASETDILDVWVDSGCSHAAVLETRPELRWPAEHVPRGLGPAPRLVPLLAAGGGGHARRAARTAPSSPTASWWTATGGRCRSPSATTSRQERAPAEVRRRGAAALGGRRGLHRGHPPVRRDPQPARRRLPAHPQHLALPARHARRLRSRARPRVLRPDGRAGPLGAAAPRRADRPGAARPTRSTSSTWSSTPTHNFCAVDLSALYLDIIKDRLYASAPNDPRRRAAQTVCFEMLTALTRLLAPVLTFTAEEVWGHIPGAGKPESVHLTTFPEERGEWANERLAAEWERLLEVRRRGVARARGRAQGRAHRQGHRRGRVRGERAGGGVAAAAGGQGRAAPHHPVQRLRGAAARGPGRAERHRLRERRHPRARRSRWCPRRRWAGRSASAAGCGARGWARTASIPRSASAARRWCARSARWGSSPRSRP